VVQILVQLNGVNHRPPNPVMLGVGLKKQIFNSIVSHAENENIDLVSEAKFTKFCRVFVCVHEGLLRSLLFREFRPET
jgi:hypothetical protein